MFETKSHLLATLLAPVLSALVAASASAVVPIEERKCIDEIHKGARKVSLVQNKAHQSCVKFYSRGILGEDLEGCLPEGLPPKVTLNVNKVLAKAAKVCTTTPSFGPFSTTNQTDVAIQDSFDLLYGLFGDAPIESAIATNGPAMKCQALLLKDVHKCQDGRLKEFGKCVANGIKFGQIENNEGIRDLCLEAAVQTEPQKKILANCITKPAKHIAKNCVDQGVDLSTAFPGCATSDAGEFADCVDAATRCSLCRFTVSVDALEVDCDLYDDEDDTNGSCANPNYCGDGGVADGEICDDGNSTSGDGCSDSCQLEAGYSCSTPGTPCATVCGDSIIAGAENCDDGNHTPGDGCDDSCQLESGYVCPGAGSACTAICGDGLIRGTETCDDLGTTPGDGCDGSCQLEAGFTCTGEPTVCAEICGDGLQVGTEGCDDGNTSPGDGCDGSCQLESGYVCATPGAACTTVCGDGLIRGAEACDDGGSNPGDGCDDSCAIEPGWVCSGEASTCNEFTVVIDTPEHGSFTTAMLLDVSGQVNYLDPGDASLTINGVSVAVESDGTFSTQVNTDPGPIFNPVRATVTDTTNGAAAHDRNVAIYGPSVADGDPSLESVALRLNDSALDKAEGLVADLAGDGLDLATLVPVGTVLINNQCFIDSLFGCLGRGTVSVTTPAPSLGGFGIDMDSQNGYVEADITVNDIEVNVYLDGSGLVPSCGIQIQSNSASFDGNYELQPDPIDPSFPDVNQSGSLDVSFDNFSTSYSGICDVPIIGDIIQAFMPDIESLTQTAMIDFLSDPDGAGPQDSPTAEAIESALADLNISGSISEGLGVLLVTDMFVIGEDTAGVTIGTDAAFTTSIGNGVGQCPAVPGAPDLTASLDVDQAFPSFSATTPVSGLPYDLGLCISSAGFNQLLKAQVECGLLVTSITAVDLGTGPITLNTALVSSFIPALATYPATTPVRIDIRPTLAPVVDGDGLAGELTQLLIAQVQVDIVVEGPDDVVVLTLAFDAELGLDLAFGDSSLDITLSEPDVDDITLAVVYNPLGGNEALIETLLPPLLQAQIPDLASALNAFPLPEFLGLELDGVEVSKNGEFLSLFGNLEEPAP